MKLTFSRTFKSITSLDSPDEFQDFTLITGLNGVGKSHLLQAILEGCVLCDGNVWDKGAIGVLDAASFSNVSFIQRGEDHPTVDEVWQFLLNLKKSDASGRQIRKLLGVAFDVDPLSLTEEQRIEAGMTQEHVNLVKTHEAYLKRLQFMQTEEWFRHALPSAFAMRVAERLGKTLFDLKLEDLQNAPEFAWGSIRLFDNTLPDLFVRYRDRYAEDILKDAETSVPSLDRSEFVRRHGEAPWDLFNKLLSEVGLSYRVNAPHRLPTVPYQLFLTKMPHGEVVVPGDLSSGEKIVLKLGIAIFLLVQKRYVVSVPAILLLDEVDAPLHPSMVRTFLKTLSTAGSMFNGVKIIATTHSPSTVALAPEGSIVVMSEGNKLRHRTKQQALNSLLVGVPALALSFDGRRQVFTESQKDAEIYEQLYLASKSLLPPERSLEFVPVGNAQGGGIDRVRDIVGRLSAAGNVSVYGLIDRDLSNVDSDRIFVADQASNGLENIVLDPLLIVAHIVHSHRDKLGQIGLPEGTTFIAFTQFSPENMQEVVRRVADDVLSQIEGMSLKPSLGSFKYAGGVELQFDARCKDCDDHTWMDAVRRRYGLGHQDLMLKIAETAVRECPAFLPSGLFETFKRLLTSN